MKTSFLILLFASASAFSFAQKPTQSIRGIVKDKLTKQVLPGASVIIQNTEPQKGALTNENGEFLIENVNVGRHDVKVQFVGYEPFISQGLILQSTKELYLEFELTEGSIKTEEVIVSASKNAFEPLNNLSVVSTRSFTSEETERMPGGVNDPGRVALSYPGVQRGQDDAENQIVVRGNSPVGILWRLEGIDIPNPNHFAVVGSSGGGVTIFSAQLLAKSDFSTGGFAAEYGNAISGVFDVRFRQGNFEDRQHRGKIGILGLDFATEGPLQKGKSSYLINYRYSTLGLLSSMGFNLVGERVTNDFQDLSFNLVFKGKNNKSQTTFFGIGGLSEERYYPVELAENRNPRVLNNFEDRRRPANMGATGFTHTYLPDNKSYIKVVGALVASNQSRFSDTLSDTNARFRYDTQEYRDTRFVTSAIYNRKLKEKLSVKTGLIYNEIFFDFLKNTLPRNSLLDINLDQRFINVEGKGNTRTLQLYTQFSMSPTDKFTVNAGYHIMYLAASNKTAVEPRVSMQFVPQANQRVSLAYGLHSRVLPLMTYFVTDSIGNYLNPDLDFIKSHHFVVAYHLYTKSKMRFSAETYYQNLYNVPVNVDPTSNYWLLNNSSDFPTFEAESKGTGENYGLDLAVEKMFSNSYFFLVTGSLLNSTFAKADGIKYNSRFNTRFSSSYTLGKEFSFKKGGILQIGGRFLFNGGFRYTPYDPILSAEAGRYIEKAGAYNEGYVAPYQRLDTRIAYRFNKPKLSGNISLDIQNTLNKLNATSVGYVAETNTTELQYRGSGLIPIISFQFDL
ncbi:TonB-dependent Receptor Plug Domain [Spirosomataceae bacterium TFI 002]|nr:TonB-dependent Receptor Plug Domain [Spirosomataceae bacterium TFI 002]